MVGGLLKQLFPALGRFVGYHATRVFRVQKSPNTSAGVAGLTAQEASRPASPDTQSPPAPADNIGLGPEFGRRVQWPCRRSDDVTAEIGANELFKLWATIPGGHKWTHYFSVYEAVFGPIHTRPLRILEIGVFHGASLKLWRKYFTHPQTLIVGIDIEPSCAAYDAPDSGIHVRIGSQADPAFLGRVVVEFGPFDLIIDDGSHHSSHIITSFNHLYVEGLKDSGIYFVEDLHANYWLPWRDSAMSFLDVCKELIEYMNAHYRNAPPSSFLVDRPSKQPNATITVPLITTLVREMRFFDSIVAIYKARREYVPYYVRVDEPAESSG
jgi:hypothetical protein